MPQRLRVFIIIIVLLYLPACATNRPPTQEAEERMELVSDGGFTPVLLATDCPPELHACYLKLVRGGQRHAVLNYVHLGLNAMQVGQFGLATKSFDAALQLVESVYSDNPNAEKARSLWYSEGQKDFKGEPYERAMLYYYRGLLYGFANDMENARASFKQSELQDAFAAEAIYRCDFALAMALSGWCSLQLGDQSAAEESFQRVKEYRPDWRFPEARENVLILIETGKSPRKLADGLGHSELKFFRGKGFNDKKARVSIDGGESTVVYPIEDIAWQAQTRGGRQVDKILAGKAYFRQTSSDIGYVLTDASRVALLSAPLIDRTGGALTIIGGGLALAGVASFAAAANANPWADVRYWRNLPDAVHWHTLQLSPGSHVATVEFLDGNGTVLSGLTKTVNFNVSSQGPSIVWIRTWKEIIE